MSAQAKKAMGRRRPKANSKSKQERFTSDKKTDEYKSKQSTDHNDVNWYVYDHQILLDVARIPFSFPAGYPFARDGIIPKGKRNYSVAGILSQGVVPTIGNAKDPSDAVNVAANGLYTFIRHANSGSKNYDANDLMLYIMALDSLYYMVSWGTRIFSTLCMYDQGNKFLPDALLDAQSIDADNFRSNFAQFRAGMNLRIPQIASLLIPNNMPIFQRHSWMFQNYFTEGDSIKDQIYFYYPEAYYVFKYDNDGAGMLEARFKGSNISVFDYFQMLDDMLNPIIADEDFNNISGDILKAYGDAGVLKLGILPDMLMAPLIKDETVLLQFKNCKAYDVHRNGNSVGDTYYDGFFNIHQDVNKQYLIVDTPESALFGYRDMSGSHINHFIGPSGGTAVENECIIAVMNQCSRDVVITSPHADVTPEEVMVSTRGTMAFDIVVTAANPYQLTAQDMLFGSEWYCGFNVYFFRQDKITKAISLERFAYESSLVFDQTDANALAIAWTSFTNSLPGLSQFKYHPEVGIVTVSIDSQTNLPTHQYSNFSFFDLDNYALVKQNVLGRMHDAAIMGEFNVPKIAFSASR